MSEYNIQMNKYNALNAEYDKLYPQPMKHANTHAKDGNDPITPSSIGAAPSTHASQHASGGADPITPDAIGAAASSHNQAASTITAGTFSATAVKAKTGTDYGTARIRNIQASTKDLTAGSSSLANGDIYLVYE